MKTTMTMTAALRCAVTISALGAGLLAGYGGSDGVAAADPGGAVAALAATPGRPTLLDDDGQPNLSDPRLPPLAVQARTTGERYASAGQAQALTRALGKRVLPVTVGCCGDSEVDAAVESAAQALQGAPEPAAVLVSGEELARAVAAADRLEALAAGRVWLVVEP